MSKTNRGAHVYVSKRPKVEARRPTRDPARAPSTSTAQAEDRDGSEHNPLELLLEEIEAVREEVCGIAEHLKTGRALHSRHK